MSAPLEAFADIPDVETTNWNAVKLLASKHGIQLRSYAEERERLRSEADHDGDDSSSAALDLGVGTPFRITAQPIEGGRIKYQFKAREGSGMTPSSSTGSISSQTGAADSGGSSSRKGFAQLAGSKSIPALRNRPSNALLKLMGQSDAATQQQQEQPRRRRQREQKEQSNASSDLIGDALRNGSDSLQGGDVLSAILALDSHVRPRSKSESNTQRAFGRAVAVSPRTAAPTAATSPWQRSPIPRVPDVGEPLFEDLNAFTAGSPPSPKAPLLSPPQPALTRQLREMQSFESAASVQTARPGEEDAASLPPPIGAGIFDVFQASASQSVRVESGMTTSVSSNSVDSGLSIGDSSSLSSSAASATSAQAMSTSAAPGDDPRFILWAIQDEPQGSSGASLILCDRNGKQPGEMSDPASPVVDTKRRSSTATGPSSSARRRSVSQQSSLLVATPKASKPILLAATRARLVAELTSEIDNRLMSSFFYTFRAFMSTHDFLDLLMLRFQWALEDPKNPQDDACRRIVRVRTYVVIKAWLTTFFELDFLTDRALRNTLTTWLNALGEDERLPSRPADLSIVKSLKKTVRNLKAAYAEVGVGGLLKDEAGWRPSSDPDSADLPLRAKAGNSRSAALSSSSSGGGEHQQEAVLQSPASTLSSSSSAQHQGTPASPATWARRGAGGVGLADEDDFYPYDDANSIAGRQSPPHLPSGNSTISRAFVNTVGRISRFRKAMGSNMLRDSLSVHPHSTDGSDIAASGGDAIDLLYTRGGVESYMRFCGLDLEGWSSLAEEEEGETGAAAEGDDEPSEENRDTTPSLCASSAPSRSTPASSIDLARQRSGDGQSWEHGDGEGGSKASAALAEPMLGLGIHEYDGAPAEQGQLQQPIQLLNRPTPSSDQQQLEHAPSKATLRTVSSGGTEQGRDVSTASRRLGLQPAKFAGHIPTRKSSSSMHRRSVSSRAARASGPNIVQIDDIDFSSDDDDDGAVRRALRRLPGARDLRIAKHVDDLRQAAPAGRSSFDSMLSLGRVYNTEREHDRQSLAGLSMASNGGAVSTRPISAAPRGFAAAGPVDYFDADEALAGYELVKGFRVEDFGSDDEEPGDVEEALRRLEGFIDEDKKAERARRVEALWEQSRARTREKEEEAEEEGAADATRSSASAVLSSSSRDADDEDGQDDSGTGKAVPQDDVASVITTASDGGVAAPAGTPAATSDTSLASSFVKVGDSLQVPSIAQTPAPARRQERTRSVTDGSRRPKTAIPSSSMATSPRWAAALLTYQHARQGNNGPRPSMAPPTSIRPHPTHHGPPPPMHRCFLLNYKSEAIAQQLCLIEAELFSSIDWTELASDGWRRRTHKGEVLDWESFYQARVRARAQGSATTSTGAVEAIIARFNLTCNWVASEIVLTRNLDERVALISKLIRIAWKCYQHSNFATLVQICLGLQSPWVERLRKTWSRVGMWEQRILRDLKIFTSPSRDFRHLRAAMRGLVGEGDDDLSGGRAKATGGVAAAASKASLASSSSTSRSAGCVPFFGIFLSDLANNDALPTWLDPTSPNQAAAHPPPPPLSHLAEPRAFDGLPPLPQGAHLEPMVNAFKFRNLARTIKTVLALQTKSMAYDFGADAGVYVKCLKIRCLEGQQMTQISHIAEP
ncbi:ras GEF [Jaminaea rosea]|uniref:Ras GEF n=1 Tax=Jaminaea rosea TaxID=1569628 RepID=A0A316UM36_9BASI|nr:ras GEF [Jaminaea rosea]PWN26309.1 ras GEF [Jaminaea rosea]